MKAGASRIGLLAGILVVLAFAILVGRWVWVIHLSSEIDTHRLTHQEEVVLLAKKNEQGLEKKP